jgi:hypothetical protein
MFQVICGNHISLYLAHKSYLKGCRRDGQNDENNDLCFTINDVVFLNSYMFWIEFIILYLIQLQLELC